MATKELKAKSSQGLKFEEASGEYQASIDPSNLGAVSSLGDDDLVIVGVGGAVKSIANSDFNDTQKYVKSLFVVWPGIAPATDAANIEYTQKVLWGVAGRVNNIVKIGVVGVAGLFSRPADEGTTIIKLSNGVWNSAEDDITLEIGDEDGTSGGPQAVSPSLVLTDANKKFYAWIDNAGGKHDTLQVQIDIEVS